MESQMLNISKVFPDQTDWHLDKFLLALPKPQPNTPEATNQAMKRAVLQKHPRCSLPQNLRRGEEKIN
jgi:hypothetical protein